MLAFCIYGGVGVYVCDLVGVGVGAGRYLGIDVGVVVCAYVVSIWFALNWLT